VVQKSNLRKIQDGGRCHLKKLPAAVSLILIKFAATMHISHCNFNSRSDQLDTTFPFPSILYHKTAKKAQITVIVQNQ